MLSMCCSQSVGNSDAMNKASGDKNSSAQSRRGIQTHPDGKTTWCLISMSAQKLSVIISWSEVKLFH